MYLGCQRVWCVVGCYVATCLFQECSAVVVLVHDVDGDAALVLACRHHCLMHMVSVHAFAAVFGQQGGVNVDDALGVGVEHVLRYEPEESCKDYPVCLFLTQIVEHCGAFVEVFAAEVASLYAEVACPLREVGVFDVVYDACHLHVISAGEVFADLLCVGAVARAEDGKPYGSVHSC